MSLNKRSNLRKKNTPPPHILGAVVGFQSCAAENASGSPAVQAAQSVVLQLQMVRTRPRLRVRIRRFFLFSELNIGTTHSSHQTVLFSELNIGTTHSSHQTAQLAQRRSGARAELDSCLDLAILFETHAGNAKVTRSNPAWAMLAFQTHKFSPVLMNPFDIFA